MRKWSVYFRAILCLIYIICCVSCITDENQTTLQDPIFTQKIKTFEQALDYYQKAKEIENDSIHAKSLVKLMRLTYKKDWKPFNRYRLEFTQTQRLHLFSKDFARVCHFSALYFDHISKQDSAFYYYYQAYKAYEKVGDRKGMGQSLYNVAIIQKNLQDYQGSIENSTRALNLHKEIKYEKYLSGIYNNLGLVFYNRGDFSSSELYHLQALELRKDEPKKKIESLNNIGLSYLKQKQYDVALDYFAKGIQDSLNIERENPNLYTMLLDNHGYTAFLQNGEQEATLDSLSKAFTLRQKLGDNEGLIMSSIHLAEYYDAKNDSKNALDYANLVEYYSKQANSYTDYIRNSQFLLGLCDSVQAEQKRGILLRKSNSINIENEAFKDQLDRIRFKVDEKDESIKKLKRSNATNLWALIIFTSIVSIVGAAFISQTFKKKKLRKAFAQGFQYYLIEKYDLTKENIDFWEAWVLGLNQKELSEKLFISEDAVKSRRKSLKKRIQNVQSSEGTFT